MPKALPLVIARRVRSGKDHGAAATSLTASSQVDRPYTNNLRALREIVTVE